MVTNEVLPRLTIKLEKSCHTFNLQGFSGLVIVARGV